MLATNFWQDKLNSQKVVKEKKLYEDLINSHDHSIRSLKDLEELNRTLLSTSMRNSIKYIASSSKAGSIFSGFGSKKKNQLFYNSTWEELFVEAIEAAGGDYNTYKKHSRTKEELRLAQKTLSSKYPDATWDFINEGQILQETYNLVKANNSKFSRS